MELMQNNQSIFSIYSKVALNRQKEGSMKIYGQRSDDNGGKLQNHCFEKMSSKIFQ